jgi:hypothetical protein
MNPVNVVDATDIKTETFVASIDNRQSKLSDGATFELLKRVATD